PPKPPTPKIGQNHFAAVAATRLTLDAGEYVIRVTADNEVRMWLDNELVLEGSSAGTAATKSVTVRNNPGSHALKVEYLQGAGGYHLDVYLTRPEEAIAKRQANAAVALLRMGRLDSVWPLLKSSPDPGARSKLIH